MLRLFWEYFDYEYNKKNWLTYLPLFLLLCFLFYQILTGEDHSSYFSGINLGIHEIGHVVLCRGDLEMLCILAGTIFQILAPVISLLIFLFRREFFGIPFCGIWIASNLYEISVYMADATKMELPLVSVGGGDVGHDWNIALGKMGLLPYDSVLARTIEYFGFLFAVVSLVLCAYMIYRIRAVKKSKKFSFA